MSFRSFALVGSGKTFGPNEKKQAVPLQGTNLPFDLLFGALFNLPDLLKPNNLSTSRLKYVFKSLCLSLADIFFGPFTKERINSENYKDFPDIFVGEALQPVTGSRVCLSNGICQNDKTSNEASRMPFFASRDGQPPFFFILSRFVKYTLSEWGKIMDAFGCV